jgi:hypothetical protein
MTNLTTTTSWISNQEYPIREPQNAQELVNLVKSYLTFKSD